MAVGRSAALGYGAAVVLLAAGVFFAVAMYVRTLERQVLGGSLVHEQLTPAGQVRPTLEVLEAVRQMELVTVEVRTRVSAVVMHESWRGDVSARVEAPARLLYGVDLSRLEADAVAYSLASRAFVLRIPAPSRIATEVLASDEEIEVQVGWLRLRSRAGEYYLGMARRGLHERARELVLSESEAAMVRDVTRRQVEALVQKIAGKDAKVVVVFADRLGIGAADGLAGVADGDGGER